MDEASPTTGNETLPSHDSRGKFAPGNKLGKGNPLAKRQAELRKAFLDAITPLKIQAVANAVYQAATEGDMIAARLYLEYVIGKAPSVTHESDEDERPALVEPPLPLPIAS